MATIDVITKPKRRWFRFSLRTLLFVLLPVLFVYSIIARGVAEPTTPATRQNRVDPFAFLQDYKISHYLKNAEELQKLGPTARANRLRDLAHDSDRAAEVYPLCRMLFVEKVRHGFRHPLIGAPSCVGRTAYRDWPLEPITIYRGVPILVVRDYQLSGFPEPPESYVEYCLSNCGWSDRKYTPEAKARLREIVSQFLQANPKLTGDADWIRLQAE